MIVIVTAQVLDDSGSTFTLRAERCEMVVNIEGDPEGNLLKTVAHVEDLAAQCVEAIHAQARDARAEGAPAAPVRPLPRRGR